MSLVSCWQAGVDWLLPCYCAGCGKQRVTPKQPFCYACLSDLNESGYDPHKQDSMAKIFWGRIPLRTVIVPFPLRSDSILQQAIHQLKYHDRPSIGQFLGKLAATRWQNRFETGSFDAMVPLPLHGNKKRSRGYNQAECICAGIRKATGTPIWNDLVIRDRATETQTKKDRGQRWENMQGKFRLHKSSRAAGKHLLLVDDVLTTGATLEACGQTLLEIPGVQISFFTIGFTENG